MVKHFSLAAATTSGNDDRLDTYDDTLQTVTGDGDGISIAGNVTVSGSHDYFLTNGRSILDDNNDGITWQAADLLFNPPGSTTAYVMDDTTFRTGDTTTDLGSASFAWNTLYVDQIRMKDDGGGSSLGYDSAGTVYGMDCRSTGLVLGKLGDANKRVLFSTDDDDIRPWTTNYLDLGTTARRWATIYAQNALDTPSDSRLKRDVKKMRLGLGFINKLDPVMYSYKNDPDGYTRMGFIAQDVEKVCANYEDLEYTAMIKIPSNVEDDKSEDDDTKQYMSMAYTELIAPMVSAIQDLSKEVKKLKKELKKLKLDDDE